jgi:AraC family transcriptional regulator, regulatory protein of adaptative response / DNA-3-methyladenine glycosylase II
LINSTENGFDPAICWQAISARDHRFDGLFFAGVVTTKVYCRSICPIPLRKPENVKWFQSAASAAAEGFRPCRRCRPHTSPGTPAWSGTAAVVGRALRLIDEGALDRGNVDELAEHVGIGGRHLRRLFAEHLGAAPIQIANARRVLRARQLLNDTGLPVNRIAFSTGFRSIRQFNHSIRTSFGQSPSEIRRVKHPIAGPRDGDELRLFLPFRPPLDWAMLLRFFRDHSVRGIETADDHCYRRTVRVGDAAGIIEVSLDPNKPRLVLRVGLSAFRGLMEIAERVRRTFDLAADPRQINDWLGQERSLRPILATHPGLRVPGAWDMFELMVLAILGQRLARDAPPVAVRLIRTFGQPIETAMPGLTHLFPPPEALVNTDLASIGIKPAKAAAIHALAADFSENNVPLNPSKRISFLRTQISALEGLGEDLSQYIAMRAIGEPQILQFSDREGRRLARNNPKLLSELELRGAADQWRPWGAYAAMYKWVANSEDPGSRQRLSLGA